MSERATPELFLDTSFIRDAAGRIVSTREPVGAHGPLFVLVRGESSSAYAVHANVPARVARQLECLARDDEGAELDAPPAHAHRYVSVLRSASAVRSIAGPAFSFPEPLADGGDSIEIEHELPLERHFRGWAPGEIAAGRAPLFGVVRDGYPVSVCFCARRSSSAAEAGVETALPYRRQGLAATATAAWARAIRASGRVPLYSTSWTNAASLAVARKLGLRAYASAWALFAGQEESPRREPKQRAGVP